MGRPLKARAIIRYCKKAWLLPSRRYSNTISLKEVLGKKIPEERERILAYKNVYGEKELGKITLSSVMGGMRGLLLLICDTSYIDPESGLFYRGIPIDEVVKCLPRFKGGEEGIPEGIWWLLISGCMPTDEEVASITNDWNKRGKLPKYLIKILDSMDKTIHPMAQLMAAAACLSPESQFNKAYDKGVKRTEFWKYAYEDAMNLCAVLTTVAAIIYTTSYKSEKGCRKLDSQKDWTENFCNMLGFDDPKFVEYMRLMLVLHADHESGNVSAHTAHLVGSALTDPYMTYSCSMGGLAGRLHGLANQEVLHWLTDLKKATGEDPSDENIKKYINDTLSKGRVVPGYGHAVLRSTDRRFLLQNEFAMKNCKDDKNIQLVTKLSTIVPEILKGLGKVSNPYPNVDAHSGVLLQHYGLKEIQYYTVLFGVSRALGAMSQLIWDRALGAPIERPKSFGTDSICKLFSNKQK